MFFPCNRPPRVEPRLVTGLLLGLNEPVLAAAELPRGPARAAIVVWREEGAAPRLAVVVRSRRTGIVAGWDWNGELDEGTLPGVVEAALSFGESMGFVFGDDALADADDAARARALAAWRELAGLPGPEAGGARPARSSGRGSASREEEVLGGEALALSKFRHRLGPRGSRAPETPVAPEAPRPPQPARERPRAEGSEPPRRARGAQRGSALGRLRLVKRAREGGGERAPGWLRLLGLF